MDDKSKHVKLYIGSMIRLRELAYYLKEVNIPYLIKNISESARLSGFANADSANEIYVYEEDFEAATKVLDNFLAE